MDLRTLTVTDTLGQEHIMMLSKVSLVSFLRHKDDASGAEGLTCHVTMDSGKVLVASITRSAQNEIVELIKNPRPL